MTTDIEARLRAVSRAICEQWNDLKPNVRDGANACSVAADTIAALKAQLTEACEALRPFRALADAYRKAWEMRSQQFADEGYTLPEEKDTERVHTFVSHGELRRAAEVLKKMENGNG